MSPPCLFQTPVLPSPFLDTTQQTLPTSGSLPWCLRGWMSSSCLWVPVTPCTPPHSSPSHGTHLFWFVYCVLCWMLSISTGEAGFHPLCSLLPSPAFPDHALCMLQPEAAFKNKTSFYHSTAWTASDNPLHLEGFARSGPCPPLLICSLSFSPTWLLATLVPVCLQTV